MAEQQPDTDGRHASSSGLAFTGASWLDARFEAWRPEWEAMVRSVGFAAGSRVLDAGCGNGSFLPLLAELVGPTGQLAAFDLDQDLLVAVDARLPAWDLPCPVATQQGHLTALPYPDGAFDAVWCANTLMYLTDEEATTALAEFRRVVRPGGLVAIKEFDTALLAAYPADPMLYARYWAASSLADSPWGVQVRGCLRARSYRRRLEAAGLINVRQRTTLAERWAPLTSAEEQTLGALLSGQARVADEELALTEADHAFWRTLRDPASPDHLIHRADFYFCSGEALAVGRVPGADA